MKRRGSLFAAAVTAAGLSLLAGCGSEEDPAPANLGGAPAAGTSAASSGVGGGGAGGVNAVAGGSGGGAGGTSGGGAGGSGGASATAGASGAGGAVPATFETVKTVITQAPCFGAGCHNDDQNPLNLRVDDQLHARLTARISTSCGNIPVVNPGNPQDSALVKILRGPCGGTPRMPLGCVEDQDATCIPAEYITAIEQWIAGGAPQQ
jgi:hypothetical protein